MIKVVQLPLKEANLPSLIIKCVQLPSKEANLPSLKILFSYL